MLMRRSVLAVGLCAVAVACGSDDDNGPEIIGTGGSAGTSTGGSGEADAASGSGGGGGRGGDGTGGGSGGSTSAGGGGTGGDAAGSGGMAGGPPSSCVNSLDCASSPDGRTICDTDSGACVQCLMSTDCMGTADCVNQQCVPYAACVNSLDCAGASDGKTICDEAAGRCVECLTDPDCGDGMACLANQCRQTCVSDNDCTPMGQLCDLTGGVCVQCIRHVDCEEPEHCAGGNCNPDICLPGTTACDGNSVRECTEVGDAYGPPTPCGFTVQCENGVCGGVAIDGGGGGTCDPAQCPPCSLLTGPCCTGGGTCGCTGFPFPICM